MNYHRIFHKLNNPKFTHTIFFLFVKICFLLSIILLTIILALPKLKSTAQEIKTNSPKPLNDTTKTLTDTNCDVAQLNNICYDTIQAAITAAESIPGKDTIEITNGTYQEVLTITTPITLNCQTDAVFDGAGLADPNVAAITISTNNVSINSCEITGYQKGIITQDPTINGHTAYTDISITNNHIHDLHMWDTNTTSLTRPSNAIQIGANSENFQTFYDNNWNWNGSAVTDFYDYTGLHIQNNTINNSYAGIVLAGTKGNQTLEHNSITNTHQTAITLNTTQDISIDSNNISNNNGSGIFISSSRNGVWEDCYEILTDNPLSPKNISITNNTIQSNGQVQWGAEFYQYEQKINNGVSIISAWPSTITITNNILGNNDFMANGTDNRRGGNGIANFTNDQIDATNNNWQDSNNKGPRDPWSGDGSYYETNPDSTDGDFAFGNLLYASLQDPVLLGSNSKNDSTTYGELPVDIVCHDSSHPFVADPNERYASVWTPVEGTNVKYIRHNIRPDGSHLLLGQTDRLITSDPNNLTELTKLTDSYEYNHSNGWGRYGGGEGEYTTQVRAYDDLNNNNKYDTNEPISQWSNPCNSIYDATQPDINWVNPIDGNYAKGDIKLQATCNGGDTQSQYVNFWWWKSSEGQALKTNSDLNDGDDDAFENHQYHYVRRSAPNGGSVNNNTFSWNLDTTDDSLKSPNYDWDGNWKFRAACKDNAGNYIHTNIEIIIDNTSPTIDKISDKIYQEGETVSLNFLDGKELRDNIKLEKLYYSADYTSPQGNTKSEADNIDMTNAGCGFDGCGLGGTFAQIYNNVTGATIDFSNQHVLIDTTEIPEGKYQIQYYATDAAGNESPHYNSTITINNISPEITFDNNQTISQGETAIFNGSFTDPSTKDNGDTLYDDGEWSIEINYGEGSGYQEIGTTPTPGTLTQLTHTYNQEGTYNATLRICEGTEDVNDDNIVDGEGTCSEAISEVTVVSTNQNPTNNDVTDNTNNRDNSRFTAPAPIQTPDYVLVDEENEEQEDVHDENKNDQHKDQDEGEVLGQKTCNEKIKAAGYVFLDTNKNNEKDNNEEGIKHIEVEVHNLKQDYNSSDNSDSSNNSAETPNTQLKTINTDPNGYWEIELCPGKYKVEVKEEALSENESLENNTQNIVVEENAILDNINFAVQDNQTSSLHWWIVAILLILAILALIYLLKRNREEKRM
jgi:parallel beta-helix repeat protein